MSMKRRRIAVRDHGPTCSLAAAIGVLLLALPASAAAASQTFTYTGAEQTFTVPTGVSAVTINAVGAPGSNGDDNSAQLNSYGAVATATVPLPAGTTTLYVEVGGPGGVPDGGFNGGGASAFVGGGGGGASDVRLASATTTPLSVDDTRLVVAGGGGGTGAACAGPNTAGGSAGDNAVSGPGAGGAGSDQCGEGTIGANGGLAGTTGGAGGDGTADLPCNGAPGTLGQGGSTPAATCDSEDWAGGGGGGYYGGGAGGDGIHEAGGGGAGSSFWVSDATNTSMSPDTTGTPSVTITYTAGPSIDATAGAIDPISATADLTTGTAGDQLVAFVAGDSPNGAGNTSKVSGGGLTWTLVGRENKALGDAEVWTAHATGTLTNTPITAKNVAYPNYDESIYVIAFANATGVGATGAFYNKTAGAPSGAINTTQNNSWVFAVGDDWLASAARTPGLGQTIQNTYTDSGGDTYWVQSTTAPTTVAGTPVRINDTAPTTDPYNLFLVEIL